MNLKRISDSKGKSIKVDHSLTLPEVKKLISSEFGVKMSSVSVKRIGKNYISGDFCIGKAKYYISYEVDKNEIYIYPPRYLVGYLRSTPFGYGGAWTSEEVSADSEEEAIAKVQEMCISQWGKLSPCKNFSIKEWS